MASTPTQTAPPTAAAGSATRVWDLPTRLFHWLLVLTIAGSFASAYADQMEWHLRCGWAAMALVAFRIVWGFVGGRWSRFSSFFYTPGNLVRYLRGFGRDEDYFEVGHSPLGSLSVFALLALLVAQVATGLVATDDIITTGPLNRFVSGTTATTATAWHKVWGQWALVALIALHLAAVAYYVFGRRKVLVGPMLRGDKTLPHGTPAARDDLAMRLFALLLLGICVALAGWVFSLANA